MLDLERVEETLTDGIVVTNTFTAHAVFQVIGFNQLLVSP